jgi:Rrf2 family iron-sulfur cluster assembly transcriptional regulator
VVSAVDGPIAVGDFGEPHQNGACDHEGQCVLLAVWADVGAQMRRLLSASTLADVARIAQGDAPWPEPPDLDGPTASDKP